MPTYPTCTFCGKNNSKPSKEHIIPKWMAREFPNSTFEITNHLTQYVRKSTKYVHLIAQYPCERCNNGWMKDLEELASPILIPLMLGKSAMLTVRDQTIIKTWFFMKSVMFDIHSEMQRPHPRHPEAKKPRPRYFTDDEHRALMSTLSIHPGYLVFIGRHHGKGRGVFQEDHSGLSVAEGDNLVPLRGPIRVYSFTLRIEHLVLQIFCAKRDTDIPLRMRDFTPWCKVVGETPFPIFFPPLRDFTDTILNEFVYRWSDRRNQPT